MICNWYLYFCVEHIVGGGNPIKASADCSDHCWGLEWPFWPNVFAKCIFYMYHEFLWVLLFFSTPGSSHRFEKIAVHAEITICFNEATRLLESTRSPLLLILTAARQGSGYFLTAIAIVIIISNAYSAIFEIFCNFWKTSHPTKKASLTPQQIENEVTKSLSPNPLWHGHFAKNQVQFGIFWPLEPHFWSTPPL